MDKLYSDEQLIAFFVSGNQDAWLEFYNIYSIHSKKIAFKALQMFKGSGITYNEFYSIAIATIYEALNHYILYSCSFYTFWRQIVFNKFNDYAKENSYNSKGNVYAGTFSLDDSYSDSKTRFDEVYGLEDPGIDKNVRKDEIVSYLLEKTQLLSQNEKQFFFYLVSEKNQEEIMTLLNITSRQFYRIRNKIRKIIDVDIIKDYFK